LRCRFVVKLDEAQELPFWWRVIHDDGDVGFIGAIYSRSDEFASMG
jgi:hypothetical protein